MCSARLAIFAALLAFSALAVPGVARAQTAAFCPAPATAQETVCNITGEDDDFLNSVGREDGPQKSAAVSFTVGSTPSYLNTVGLYFNATEGMPTDLTVSIRRPSTTHTSGVDFGDAGLIGTLSGTNPTTEGVYTFTARANEIRLEANTTYFLVLSASAELFRGQHRYLPGSTDDRTETGSAGWSIGDYYYSNAAPDMTSGPLRMFLVADNITPNVRVTPTEFAFDEIGVTGNGTYTVVLNDAPSAAVTVALSATTEGVVTFAPAELTFTPQDWNYPRSISVIAVNDDLVNAAPRSTLITHTSSSSDADYDGRTIDAVNITVNDDDADKPLLNFASANYEVDEGASVVVTATLSKAHTGPVLTRVVATPTAPATADDLFNRPPDLPYTLYFPTGATTATVTLYARHDRDSSANKTFALSFPAPLGHNDAALGTMTTATLTIANQPNGTVTITPMQLVVNEAGTLGERAQFEISGLGGSRAYTVVLDQQPSADVKVTARSSDLSAVRVTAGPPPALPGGDGSPELGNAGDLLFTPTNWSIPQTLTAIGVNDDAVNTPDRSAQIEHTASGATEFAGALDAVVVTVSDDDGVKPRLSFAAHGWLVNEGESIGVELRLDRAPTSAVPIDGAPAAPVTIPLIITPREATPGTDYTIPSEHSVTFGVGETSAVFLVTTVHDVLDEEDESIEFRFGELPLAVVPTTAAPFVAQVVIVDDDPPKVNFEHGAYRVSEGATRTIAVTLAYALSESVTIPIVVSTPTENGAQADDYTATVTQVIFNAGQTRRAFSFTANHDHDVEDVEIVQFEFGELPEAVEAGGRSITNVYIDSFDPVQVSFTQPIHTLREGESRTVRVRISHPPDASVNIGIRASTSIAPIADPNDYSLSTSTLTFTPTGPSEQSFTVTATEDENDEARETLTLGFMALPTGVSAGTQSTAEVRIHDRQALRVEFSQGVYRADEGQSARLTARLTEAQASALSVGLELVANAQAPLDRYTLGASTLTFQAGVTERSFTVSSLRDFDANDDGVLVRFVNVPTELLVGRDAYVVFEDTDATGVAASFAQTNYSLAEGETRTVTVTLSRAPGMALTLPLAGSGGDLGTDYTLTPSTLSFGASETEKTFVFTAVNNTRADAERNIRVGFGALALGLAAGTPAVASFAIADDENAVRFDSARYSVLEGDTLRVTATLRRAHDAPLALQLSFAPPSLALDYTPLTRAVNFPANQTSVTFDLLSALSDGTIEDTEVLEVGFMNLPVGFAPDPNAGTAQVSILDGRPPPMSAEPLAFFSQSLYTVDEGEDLEITVQLTQPVPDDVDRLTANVVLTPVDDTLFDFNVCQPCFRTLRFFTGESRKSFTMMAVRDADSDNGLLKLDFDRALSNLPVGPRAFVQIRDTDVPLTITFDSAFARVEEGAEHTVYATLSRGPGYYIEVPVLTTDEGASTADYTLERRFQFSANQTRAAITFVATDDTEDENDERVRVTFGELPPGMTVVSRTETQLVIGDNDPIYVFFEHPMYALYEGGALEITARLSRAPGGTGVTIPLGREPLGETFFSGVPANLTFAANSDAASFTFRAAENGVSADEEALLFLGNLPTGYASKIGRFDADAVVIVRDAPVVVADAGPDLRVERAFRRCMEAEVGAKTGCGQVGDFIPNAQLEIGLQAARSPGVAPITYTWTQQGAPAVTLADADQRLARAILPEEMMFPPESGVTLTFQVLVADPNGLATDTVDITIVRRLENTQPVADAGADFSVDERQAFTLDASGSSDADDDTLLYHWRLGAGVCQELSDPELRASLVTSATRRFTTPRTRTPLPRIYSVVVGDGRGGFDCDTVTVTVNPVNEQPQGAHLEITGVDDLAAVPEGTTLSLEAIDAIDRDGDPLIHQWIVTGEPAPRIVQTNPNSPHAQLIAPTQLAADVEYTIAVRVTDPGGLSSGSNIETITVIAGPNNAPIADAGPDITVSLRTTVQLDGTGSSDPEGEALTYAWTKTAGPDAITLSSSSNPRPHFFVPSSVGSHDFVRFRLNVTDARGVQSAGFDTVTVNFAPTGDSPGGLTLTGDARQGATLTATLTDGDGVGDFPPQYSWFRNHVAVRSNSEADAARYVLTQDDVGARIHVSVLYNDNVPNPQVTLQTAQTDAVVALLDILGAPLVGQTLALDPGRLAHITPGAVIWRAADAANDLATAPGGDVISGASGTTLVLTEALAGKHISASLSVDSNTAHSASVGPVAARPNTSGVIGITGVAREGETLTAAVTDADGLTGTVTWNWFATDAPSTSLGATSELLLSAAMVGKQITANASYTDDAGNSENLTATSAPITAQPVPSVRVALWTSGLPQPPERNPDAGPNEPNIDTDTLSEFDLAPSPKVLEGGVVNVRLALSSALPWPLTVTVAMSGVPVVDAGGSPITSTTYTFPARNGTGLFELQLGDDDVRSPTQRALVVTVATGPGYTPHPSGAAMISVIDDEPLPDDPVEVIRTLEVSGVTPRYVGDFDEMNQTSARLYWRVATAATRNDRYEHQRRKCSTPVRRTSASADTVTCDGEFAALGPDAGWNTSAFVDHPSHGALEVNSAVLTGFAHEDYWQFRVRAVTSGGVEGPWTLRSWVVVNPNAPGETPTPPAELLPVLSIATAHGSPVREGGELRFTLTLAGANEHDGITANVDFSGAGTSFLSSTVSRSVSFAANVFIAELRISTVNDGVAEADGEITATLRAPADGAGYTLGTTSASVMVQDISPPPAPMVRAPVVWSEHVALCWTPGALDDDPADAFLFWEVRSRAGTASWSAWTRVSHSPGAVRGLPVGTSAEGCGAGDVHHVVGGLANNADHDFQVRGTSRAGLGAAGEVTARPMPLALVADAGDDRSVVEARVQGPEGDAETETATLVQLDGAGSFDPNLRTGVGCAERDAPACTAPPFDGEEARGLSFAWRQTAGRSVALDGANTARPTFFAPNVTQDTALTFELTVSADDGRSATDSVMITVRGDNDAPRAFASASQTRPASGDSVTLTSRGEDPEGTALTFTWTQRTGDPVVALSAISTTATGARHRLTVPDFSAFSTAPQTQTLSTGTVLVFHELVFTLRASDGVNNSPEARVTLHIPQTSTGEGEPNIAVSAGDDQADIVQGAEVTLAGVVTNTDDFSETARATLQYEWRQLAPDAPQIALTGADTLTPRFTVPLLDLRTPVTLNFQLTARHPDGSGNAQSSAIDTVSVALVDRAPTLPPVASIRIGVEEALDQVLPAGSGGDNTLSYTLTPRANSAPLPDGFAFDPVTRRLTGTPSPAGAGTYRLTYRVQDADLNTGEADAATRNFTLTISPVLVNRLRLTGTGGNRILEGNSRTAEVRIDRALPYDLEVGLSFAYDTSSGASVTPFGAAAVATVTTGATTGEVAFTYAADDADLPNLGASLRLRTSPNYSSFRLRALSLQLVDDDHSALPVALASTPRCEGIYHPGEIIAFRVTFPQAIAVRGRPTLPFVLGSDARSATYARLADAGASAVFEYTVAEGESDADGVSLAASASLALPGNARISDRLVPANVLSNNPSSSLALDTTAVDAASAQHRVATRPAPTGVTASAASASSLALAWTAPAAPSIGSAHTSYEVRHRPAGTSAAPTTATAAGSATSATLSGLSSGARYDIEIAALYTGGCEGVARLANVRAGGGVSAEPRALALSEVGEGNRGEYTLVLDSTPSANVTITPSASAAGVVSFTPAALSFTPGNWNAAQTVVVTATDDAVDNAGDERSITLSHAATGDTAYAGLADLPTVAVTVADDDGAAGLAVTPQALTLGETGAASRGAYALALTSTPSANVIITPSSSDAGIATFTPSALTFTPDNWNTAQSVQVSATDDEVDNNGARSAMLTHAASGDADYAALTGVALRPVTVTVTDDDRAGLTLESGPRALHESGANNRSEYTLQLHTQPSAIAIITPTVSTAGVVSVAPTQLSFTAENWRSVRTLTVTAVDDSAANPGGPRSATITHAATGDPAYSALSGDALRPITFTVTDDDGPGVLASRSALALAEDLFGRRGEYTLRLATAPSANVVITPSVAPESVASVRPAALTFTPENWNAAQTVSVTATDDNVDNAMDPRVAEITHTVTGDADYAALSASALPRIALAVADDDVVSARITATPRALTLPESGANNNGSYTLVLDFAPDADVVITPSIAPAGVASFTPPALTFTAGSGGNWNTAQTVSVTATDDIIDNPGDERSAVITHAVAGDADYAALSGDALQPIALTVTDDGDTLAPTPMLSIAAGAAAYDEGDGNAVFTLTATPAPSADLMVRVTLGGADDYVAEAARTQTVTIAASETTASANFPLDDDTELDAPATATATIAAPSGDDYTVSASAGSATTSLTDNDVAPPVNLRVTPDDARLVVRWDAPDASVGAVPTSYRVCLLLASPTPDFTASGVCDGAVSTGATSVSLSGVVNGLTLTNDVEYALAVRSVFADNTSAWSAPVTGTPTDAATDTDITALDVFTTASGGSALASTYDDATQTYAVTFAHSVATVYVQPVLSSATASATYGDDDTALPTDARTAFAAPAAGASLSIAITVTAEDGMTTADYTLTLTREVAPASAPTGVFVVAGDEQLTVNWSAGTGASTATGHEVCVIAAGVSNAAAFTDAVCAVVTSGVGRVLVSSGTSHTRTGLVNDTEYTAAVRGTHANGNSAWVPATNAARPSAEDRTPNAFVFTPRTGVEPSVMSTSNAVTIAGLEAGVSVAVSVTGDSSAMVSINGGAATTSGTVRNGDTLAASVTSTSCSAASATASASVTVGDLPAVTYTVTRRACSSDATLSNLTLTNVNFGTFAPATLTYTASVANSVSATTVTATLSDADRARGVALAVSGGGSVNNNVVTLVVGVNTIAITVTAENGDTQRYVVTVTREVAPVSAPTNVRVIAGDEEITVQWTAATAPTLPTGYEVCVIAAGVSNAAAFTAARCGVVTSGPGRIAVATSPHTRAELMNGTQYTAAVRGTHANGNSAWVPATNAITPSSDDNTPDAFPFTHSTNAEPSTATTSNTVTITELGSGVNAQVSVTGGTLSINGGAAVTSGTAANGDTIAVTVTSPSCTDGTPASATATATVTVGTVSEDFRVTRRACGTDATLSALQLSGVTFAPVFAAATTSYTATVVNSASSTTVTATPNDTRASVSIALGGSVVSGTAVNLAVGENRITITVRAESESASTDYTVIVMREPPPPGTPGNLLVTALNQRVEIRWATPSGAPTHYRVCVVASTDNIETACASASTITGTAGVGVYNTSDATATTHIRTGLENDTPYGIAVRAVNDFGESAWATRTATPMRPRLALAPERAAYRIGRDAEVVFLITSDQPAERDEALTVVLSGADDFVAEAARTQRVTLPRGADVVRVRFPLVREADMDVEDADALARLTIPAGFQNEGQPLEARVPIVNAIPEEVLVEIGTTVVGALDIASARLATGLIAKRFSATSVAGAGVGSKLAALSARGDEQRSAQYARAIGASAASDVRADGVGLGGTAEVAATSAERGVASSSHEPAAPGSIEARYPDTHWRTLDKETGARLAMNGLSALNRELAGGVGVWASAAHSDISGDPLGGQRTSYDGEGSVWQVGIDRRSADGALLLGVAASWNTSEADFTQRAPGAVSEVRGVVERSGVMVNPYLAWRAGKASRLWLLGGYGTGTYELAITEGDREETDATQWLLAGGAEATVKQGSRFTLAARLGGLWSRSEVDAGAEFIPAFETTAWQTEGEVELASTGARVLRPYLLGAVRIHGGDGLRTDAAFDIGGGLRADFHELGLQFDLGGRGQVQKLKNRSEHVFYGSLRYDFGADQRGFTATLTQGMSQVLRSDWRAGVFEGGRDAAGALAAQGLQARFGYGWGARLGERGGVLTAFASYRDAVPGIGLGFEAEQFLLSLETQDLSDAPRTELRLRTSF